MDVTARAFQHLESLGAWYGIEDCDECNTVLSFSVEVNDGDLRIECQRL